MEAEDEEPATQEDPFSAHESNEPATQEEIYDHEEEDEGDYIQNEIKQTINYSKFKVDELKKMCEDKELENYKSLKKAQLVALLENS